MKTIVTHQSPDLDSVASAWLIKRYIPEFQDAKLTLVAAGHTLEDMEVDADPDIIHCDTGGGRFDHHHIVDPEKKHSATERVYTYLCEHNLLKQELIQPLGRISAYATLIDHLGEINFPDPLNDRYDFALHMIIVGMKKTDMTDEAVYENAWNALDGILIVLREKGEAEQVLADAIEFNTKWGKGLAINSENTAAQTMALFKGYVVVVQKNPKTGAARIKSIPDPKIDLTPAYNQIQKDDTAGEWFLHISKNMLLNASSKGAAMAPTALSLTQLQHILETA